jgi:hypothetical protein
LKEATGSSWTFKLVIVFIFLFTTFLILTINYSKSYRVKNEVISILEKYEGFTNDNGNTSGSKTIINDYLRNSGYKETGSCPIEVGDPYFYGVTNLETGDYAKVISGGKYYYCVKQNLNSNGTMFYQLILFYHFSLPFLGNIRNYQVTGTTAKIIYDSSNNNYIK